MSAPVMSVAAVLRGMVARGPEAWEQTRKELVAQAEAVEGLENQASAWRGWLKAALEKHDAQAVVMEVLRKFYAEQQRKGVDGGQRTEDGGR